MNWTEFLNGTLNKVRGWTVNWWTKSAHFERWTDERSPLILNGELIYFLERQQAWLLFWLLLGVTVFDLTMYRLLGGVKRKNFVSKRHVKRQKLSLKMGVKRQNFISQEWMCKRKTFSLNECVKTKTLSKKLVESSSFLTFSSFMNLDELLVEW